MLLITLFTIAAYVLISRRINFKRKNRCAPLLKFRSFESTKYLFLALIIGIISATLISAPCVYFPSEEKIIDQRDYENIEDLKINTGSLGVIGEIDVIKTDNKVYSAEYSVRQFKDPLLSLLFVDINTFSSKMKIYVPGGD